jgi:hypothetical protein
MLGNYLVASGVVLSSIELVMNMCEGFFFLFVRPFRLLWDNTMK